MEKIVNREKYVEVFKEFLDLVKLNDEFMEQLKTHEYFGHHIKTIEALNKDEKKVYIFLELTKERKSCEAIIEMLEESNQLEAAQKLKTYNTSPGLINILSASTDVMIPVLRAKIPKAGSNPYTMLGKPRGLFIIINNVPNELLRESERFKHIFTELLFEVKLLFNLNVKEIEEQLKRISQRKEFADEEAFGVMVITHGEDERVLGFDACEECRKPLNQRNQEIIKKDRMKISDLVQIFSKDNCKPMARKPKVFIFDCCREKVEKSSVDIISLRTQIEQNIQLSKNNECVYEVKNGVSNEEENEKLILKFKYADQNWVNENTHTFIIYSCSEGYYSLFSGGISAFGQAFSHAIARYACEESLQTIMCRTCTLMEEFKKVGMYSAPELRKQCTGRELYFNAGVYEQKKQTKKYSKN